MDGLIFIALALLTAYGGYRYVGLTRLPRIRFALFECTIVCATLVLLLVFWEILELGTVYFRALLWRWLTLVLLCLLGFIFPLFHLDTCVPTSVRAKSSLYFAWISLGYAAYIFGFVWLSTHLPIHDTGKTKSSTSEWIRQELLASNALIGITIMAALCGLSSVIAPYTAFVFKDTTTEGQLQQMSSSVANTEVLIAEEELRLSKLNLELRGRFRKSTTNIVGRIFGQVDETTRCRNECQAELRALERLLFELKADKDDMERSIKVQRFNATLVGRLIYAVYCVFAVYCIYRLGNGYRRMMWYLLARPQKGENGPRDALVTQIATSLYHRYPSYTIDNWTRIIGMLMSGVVICTSLNGMFSTLRKLQRRVRPNIFTDPLFVAHMYGIYAIACATILRLNVPENLSGAIITALKFPLEVPAVQLWNDMILCGTSTLVIFSLVVLGRHKEREYDEEMEKYE